MPNMQARQWNYARCDGSQTGFPILTYVGTTDLQAGFRGDNHNVVGFAHVDGPGRRIAYADVYTKRSNRNVIQECDIRIDYYEDHDNHSEFDVPRLAQHEGYCLQDTLTHEFGHWVKLNDVVDNPECNPGGLRVCLDYYWYTMNECVQTDEHHREDLHATWYMYNGANPAPSVIGFSPADQHAAKLS